jgi:catechol 2,3-dioxygenase-like lactoylglutathione lyase family enzyme
VEIARLSVDWHRRRQRDIAFRGHQTQAIVRHLEISTTTIFRGGQSEGGNMKLGAFSVSLNVKDIQTSKSFLENLGFQVFGGDVSQNWLIMKNGSCTIGLFQGMFEKNILTFNPGWDENATKLNSFTDVRELQRQLKAKGIRIETEADEETSGPASFVIVDPDGNPILVDQHV